MSDSRFFPGGATVFATFVFLFARPAVAQDRIAVLTEPGTPVVAADLLLSVGPADEGDDSAGIAYLAARTVVGPLRVALDSIGAEVSITPHKDALSFTVTAAPEVWEEATERLAAALFREPPTSAIVTRERRAIAAELRGRAANPADAATRAMDQAFFGLGHPWGRPTVGTPQSVERISFDEVDAFLRENFTPDRAFAAVAGPVDAADAIAHLRPLLGSTFPAPVELVPFRPVRAPVRREYNSITTWVSASFRFPETGDEEALRFVAYLVTDAVSFGPAQRSVYNVWSDVFPRTGAGEIRLQMVTPPDEASDWVERIGDAVERIASRTMIDDVFEAHLRRYGGERLMRLISPEDRARAASRQLFLTGRITGLSPDLSEMTQERVRRAARALESPAIVLLGPSVDN